MHSLARICATFPPSQCNQLKMGRLLEVGAGRNSAPIGWRKHTIVVIVPRMAWGLSSADQAPSSRKINTNAAIVSPHVKIMNIRCHWNECIFETLVAKLTGWAKALTYSKPLIFAAQLAANPGLLEVTSQQDTNRSGSNPGDDHKCTMQA